MDNMFFSKNTIALFRLTHLFTLSRYIPREFRYNPTGTVHCTEAGVLDIPYSAKPAQRSSHTGPPGYIGWTRFQPV
jgi:hypothetical protein